MELISVPEKKLNCSSSSFRRRNFFFSSVQKLAGTAELLVPGTGTVLPLLFSNCTRPPTASNETVPDPSCFMLQHAEEVKKRKEENKDKPSPCEDGENGTNGEENGKNGEEEKKAE